MPKRKTNTLNHALCRARIAAGMSQRDLARDTGLPQSFLARIELGDKTPNFRHAIAILKATDAEFVLNGKTKLA